MNAHISCTVMPKLLNMFLKLFMIIPIGLANLIFHPFPYQMLHSSNVELLVVPYTCLPVSLFCLFAKPCDRRDLSSPTRDQTCAPCNGSMES